MTKPKLRIEDLKKHFKGKNEFTTSDILEFYAKQEKDLKRSTVNWRVYHLTLNGVIDRVKPGLFKLI